VLVIAPSLGTDVVRDITKYFYELLFNLILIATIHLTRTGQRIIANVYVGSPFAGLMNHLQSMSIGISIGRYIVGACGGCSDVSLVRIPPLVRLPVSGQRLLIAPHPMHPFEPFGYISMP
jgi:hypothetical protein